MAEKSSNWGTREWFDNKIRDQHGESGSYYSHKIDGYQRRRHEKIARAIEEEIPNKAGLHILDVGCALGDLGGDVANRFIGSELIGIDFVFPVVMEAKKTWPQHTFMLAALPELPFKDSCFDLVICSEVFYYLNESDRKTALSEVSRVLGPGGVLVFTSRLDDGSRYFTKKSALTFVAETMEIDSVKLDFNNLYHRLYRRLLQLIKLCIIVKGENNDFEGVHPFYSFVKRFSKIPVLGSASSACICLSSYVSKTLLRAPLLSDILGLVSRAFFDRATNIVILARKGL